MRALLLEILYEWSKVPYQKWFKKETPWELSVSQLLMYPENSLGFHLGSFLLQHDFTPQPKLDYTMQITQSVNRKALMIATVSFLLGTILFLMHLIIAWEQLIIIGLFYVMIASVLNGITFMGLLANSIINYHRYQENLTTVLIFLLNIPIAVGYFLLVTHNPFHNTIF